MTNTNYEAPHYGIFSILLLRKLRGLIPGKVKRAIYSPQRPSLYLGSSSLLVNSYRGIYPCGYSGRGVKLTTHLQLVPRSRILELDLIYIYGQAYRCPVNYNHIEEFYFMECDSV
jgi:hypothetical protein